MATNGDEPKNPKNGVLNPKEPNLESEKRKDQSGRGEYLEANEPLEDSGSELAPSAENVPTSNVATINPKGPNLESEKRKDQSGRGEYLEANEPLEDSGSELTPSAENVPTSNVATINPKGPNPESEKREDQSSRGEYLEANEPLEDSIEPTPTRENEPSADNITATGIVHEISNEEEKERKEAAERTAADGEEAAEETDKNKITAFGKKNKLKPTLTVGDQPTPKITTSTEPEDIEALGTKGESPEKTLGTKGDNESKPGEKDDNEKWQTSWYNLGKFGLAPALDLAIRGTYRVLKSTAKVIGGVGLMWSGLFPPTPKMIVAGLKMFGDGLTLGLVADAVKAYKESKKSPEAPPAPAPAPPAPPPSPSPGPSNTGSSSKKVSDATVEESPGSGLGEKLTDVEEAMASAKTHPSGNRTLTHHSDSLVQRGRKDAGKQDVDIAIDSDEVVQNVEEPEAPEQDAEGHDKPRQG